MRITRKDKVGQQSVYKVSKEYCAPILYQYVEWIIKEAIKKDIHKLYFLARDGYNLMLIARKICEYKNIDIECSYLYCSRQALRLPTYHLLDRDEKYRLLFMPVQQLSMSVLAGRLNLDCNEIKHIFSETGIDLLDNDIFLNLGKYNELCDKLKKSNYFNSIVDGKSVEAYHVANAYFHQEGLFLSKRIALVDSGWNGSMQRSVGQLLRADGYEGTITGFYFGLYSLVNDPVDGNYLSWYFRPKGNFFRKVLFNNYVFECMLQAPHATTMGYKINDMRVDPVLGKSQYTELQLEKIKQQTEAALDYTVEVLNSASGRSIDWYLSKSSKWKLCKLMVFPSKEIVDVFSNYTFSDECTDQESRGFVSEQQILSLKSNYSLGKKIIDKLFLKEKKYSDIFWPYGVAAYLKGPLKVVWYRLNIFMIYCVRYLFD